MSIETSPEFATGNRLQFSALNKELGISNRDMSTITKNELDRLTVLMDGRSSALSASTRPSSGNSTTAKPSQSHGAQGLTTGRVIAKIDTDPAAI